MSPRTRAAAVVLAVAVPLSTAWLAQPSYADAPAAGDPRPTTVSVQLSASDPDALAAVSSRPIRDREARLDRLADLVPESDQRDSVAADLRSRGFTVDDESTWSITATAPADVVSEAFGSASATRAGTLPDVPAELADDVDGVYPTNGPALLHPLSTGALTGADVRNADSAAGITPSTGANDNGITVATLQLATWNPADLTTYASSIGLPDPVASGQYRAIVVDGGPRNATGTEEVALDQESLLSVAPTARQAAYFAPNSAVGMADALGRIYADVTGTGATPDPHLVALSISWGQCEAGWGTGNIATIQTRLAALVAAGVTVFAASGDDGIYDCGSSSTAAVDFPGSSPSVVAVGATKLSAPASAPNLGANWLETAWSCNGLTSCRSGGTGGGVSTAAIRSGSAVSGFARPSWQSAVSDAPFAGATARMVPDIAADGDPQTGIVIYSGGQQYQYGGTSLAAPLSAGQLANLLGDAGTTTGRGDIHAALYQAYSATRGLAATDPHRVFRDVTSGSNGAAADAGPDPSVSAGAGYDTVSGLGGVLWAALAPYLNLSVPLTPVSPTATTTGSTDPSAGGGVTSSALAASARLLLDGAGRHGQRGQHRPHGHSARGTQSVIAQWSTSVTGASLTSATVKITTGGKVVYAGTTGSGSAKVRARPGQVYVLTVLSRDSSGNVVQRTARLKVRG